MDNINRALVKKQAQGLIKDKVFILFVITFVAVFLTSGLSVVVSVVDSYNTTQESEDSYESDDYSDYYDYYGGLEDYFNQYNYDNGNSSSDSDNPIESFGNNSQGNSGDYDDGYGRITQGGSDNGITANDTSSSSLSYILIYAVGLIGLILSPLLITLMGFYVAFIKRNPDEHLKLGKELGNLFKKSFDSTYLKKLVIYVLKNLFSFLLSLLFLIPGIIYNYSTYFAYQLMNDYPNLKPTEAGKLSRKIIKGNRTELFVLDLSFIPWYLLCCITLGIASIYVLPYIYTTQALYYENFRLRALAEGRITEDDFLSADELKQKYEQNTWQGNGYYNQNNSDNYYYNQNGGYTNGYGNAQGYNNNSAQQNNYSNQNNYYYQPQNDNVYGNPQQNNYQNPYQPNYQPPEEPYQSPQQQNEPENGYKNENPADSSVNNPDADNSNDNN